MRNLYMVHDGMALEVDEPVETDGVESVLAVAESPEVALRLASLYDAGRIGVDNVSWHGNTIVALSDTGD